MMEKRFKTNICDREAPSPFIPHGLWGFPTPPTGYRVSLVNVFQSGSRRDDDTVVKIPNSLRILSTNSTISKKYENRNDRKIAHLFWSKTQIWPLLRGRGLHVINWDGAQNQAWWAYYQWAKQTKFLLTVVYGSPRRHSNCYIIF